MIKYLPAVLAALAVVFLAHPAVAQTKCGAADKVVGFVTGPKYGEAPFLTLGAPDGPIRLYVNLATGTWTIIGFPTSMPSFACVIGGGTGIERQALPEISGAPL